MAWGTEYLKIFAMLVLATAVIREPGHVRWMGGAILLVLAYLAFTFNVRYYADGYLYNFRHGHGGLDNNGTGLLLAIGIPLVYAWAASKRRWWAWIVAAVVAAGSVAAIGSIVGYRRLGIGAWLAILGAVALVVGAWAVAPRRAAAGPSVRMAGRGR
jgi:hypothetical protein